MKAKMHCQVQPREIAPPCNEEAQREIQKFLRALNSYPARAAKDPGVSFRQHLCSAFETRGERRDTHPRRH